MNTNICYRSESRRCLLLRVRRSVVATLVSSCRSRSSAVQMAPSTRRQQQSYQITHHQPEPADPTITAAIISSHSHFAGEPTQRHKYGQPFLGRRQLRTQPAGSRPIPGGGLRLPGHTTRPWRRPQQNSERIIRSTASTSGVSGALGILIEL